MEDDEALYKEQGLPGTPSNVGICVEMQQSGPIASASWLTGAAGCDKRSCVTFNHACMSLMSARVLHRISKEADRRSWS